jgi:RND superfamily putative drug exporter
MTFGEWVIRRRWLVLSVWIALAAALWVAVPKARPGSEKAKQFLPPEADYIRALELLGQAFPGASGFSEAVVVFERPGEALRPEDLGAIEAFAKRIGGAPTGTLTREELDSLSIRSPASIPSAEIPLLGTPVFRNPLLSRISPAGQATIVSVGIPSNYITIFSSRVVEHIRGLLARGDFPPDLRYAVTGSAAFGYGYARAAQTSSRRTTWVTICAVVLILLVVYRAPLGALVPLAAISLAAAVVSQMLELGEHVGLQAGTAEKIFVFVLMYGAGVDYSLLLISRFREKMGRGQSSRPAAAGALDATLAPITASALTDALGLLMLVFAQFLIFRTTGPVVAIALVVAMLSALTLVPALVGIVGRRIAWPGPARPRMTHQKLWFRVARTVVHNPGKVLACTLLLLGLPVWRGLNVQWVFDSLAGFKPTYRDSVGNASEGVLMARRHWPVGEIAPTTLLVHSSRPLGLIQWSGLSQSILGRLKQIDGVANVRSFNQPLGRTVSPWANALLQSVGGSMVTRHYVSEDQRTARLEVILEAEPMSAEAMATLERIRDELADLPPVGVHAADAAGQAEARLEVLAAGATAETLSIRDVTRRDAKLVAGLALAVIFLTVLVLLRDPILAGFMIFSTVLSYLSTLGVVSWLLVDLLGADGLDWKVEILLFVVMVAVGVDYNIFLASRMRQEARDHPPRQAVELAVVHTGPVISSCGLIMAASLGSLMAGQLSLLTQLGFALALGMLMDTFVIRPLVLPAFASLTRRTG